MCISGVTKKLQTASRLAECKELAVWSRAISNHMYWAAASSKGATELIVPKWESLLNHIRGIHEHDNELFPVCSHGDIAEMEWLREGAVPLFCVCNGMHLLLCACRQCQGARTDRALK